MSDNPMAQTARTASRGGMKFKHIILLLCLAFAGGGAATWWLAGKYAPASPPVSADKEGSSDVAPSPTGNVGSARVTGVGTTARDEGQVVPVYVTDSAISTDAIRGEGLLLVFAVRRTLDNGTRLGYLAEQLRLRFGATQPQAVATVISAAQTPVTRENLQSELRGLAPILLTGHRDTSLWVTVRRELSQLFVLRRDAVGGADVSPTLRLVRAQALIEGGKLTAAMQEVAAMPGASAAQSWMARARRYTEARAALDRLEQMALMRPVVVPVSVPTPEAPLPDTPEATP